MFHSSQYFLSEGDVGKNVAAVSQPKLAELNSYVKVKVLEKEKLTPADLECFQVRRLFFFFTFRICVAFSQLKLTWVLVLHMCLLRLR